jgi:hypothetical protein
MNQIILGYLLLIALTLPHSAADPEFDYEATMTSDQVVPPSGSTGSGHVLAVFNWPNDDSFHIFSIQVSYEGLTAPTTGAYVCYAPRGADGDTLVTAFSGSFPSDSSTHFFDTEFVVGLWEDERAYIVITTEAYPNGEIRGQFVPVSNPATLHTDWGLIKAGYLGNGR